MEEIYYESLNSVRAPGLNASLGPLCLFAYSTLVYRPVLVTHHPQQAEGAGNQKSNLSIYR